MRIAFLGCGYVANMYRLTLAGHPELELVGVYDKERSRAESMAELTGACAYPDFESLLADDTVNLVLNLTNPKAHFQTSQALLEAGKHVYTEKPVAMQMAEALSLSALAKARGRLLCAAPCTLLNPVAQTLWRAIREDLVGRVRLVYAEMDDGMVPRAPFAKWVNEAGTAWPAVDEFQTGCTVEHAGYVLSWLCAMFGPAERVTSFSSILLEDKIPDARLDPAADFSVAAIQFRSGVVARLTNGLYATHDHKLRLFGDDGVMTVDDPRSDRASVRLQRYRTLRRRRFLWPISTRLRPSEARERIARYRGSQTRDFCRAVADMADAIRTGRPPRLAADFGVHVTEVTLACHQGGNHKMRTEFAPMEPEAWAA